MKTALENLSLKLKNLHQDLMLFQGRKAEATDERRYGPYDLLRLSMSDPRFEWLKKISSLVARIDERMDQQEEIEALDVREFFDKTSRLFDGSDPVFSEPYTEALESNPHTFIKQAEVLTALKALQPHAKDMHEMHVRNEKEKLSGV